MKLSDERIRKKAMDAAEKLAPLFARLHWEWVGCGGVPGLEDIAAEIERGLKQLRAHPPFYGGGLEYVLEPAENEVKIYLALDTFYVGDDADEQED